MTLLEAGVDVSVIALWLGHEGIEATNMYLHADLGIKERALAKTAPSGTKPGRYRPPTGFSPSWRPSDYAELPSREPLSGKASRRLLGIISCSA